MTETRKAIIELIEPYMNKTLCEGCITKQWRYSKIIWKDYNENWEFNNRYRFIDNWENYFTWPISTREIIWHYDITAIWGYINSINLWWVWPYYFDSISISKEYYILTPTWDNDYARIPNKPLHLYTEQEDKDLLELLLKLK